MIIKNAEIWYAKLNPKRPNRNLNKDAPTWEVQIRTKDKAVKKMWQEMNLNVTLVEPDDDSGVYYRVNLKKKSVKKDGEPAKPVELVDGRLKPIDPDTIGNGSIANVRVFQHDYEFQGKKGIASVLMAVQLVKHIVYVPKEGDGERFEETDTETIEPEPEDLPDGDDAEDVPY
jgi:hypothetical protein